MSIDTMSDELLALAKADVIARLGSVHRIESELLDKLAQYDTEVARRKRFAAPPWDDDKPELPMVPIEETFGVNPHLDTLEERVE
jgi:hypothetical protein